MRESPIQRGKAFMAPASARKPRAAWRRPLLCLLTLLALAPGRAHAAPRTGWGEVLRERELQTWPCTGQTLVIPGTTAPEDVLAASAIRTALAAHTAVELLPAHLAEPGIGRPDSDALAQTRYAGAETTVLVRRLPTAPPVLVISIFDKHGRLKRALSLTAPSASSSGKSTVEKAREARATGQPIASTSNDAAPPAEDVYLEQYVHAAYTRHFRNTPAGRVAVRTTRFFHGHATEPLSNAALHRLLGLHMPPVATPTQSKEMPASVAWLLVGATTTVLGGIGVAATLDAPGSDRPLMFMAVTGAGLVCTAAAGIVIGTTNQEQMETQKTHTRRIHQAVRAYNRALAEALELDPKNVPSGLENLEAKQ